MNGALPHSAARLHARFLHGSTIAEKVRFLALFRHEGSCSRAEEETFSCRFIDVFRLRHRIAIR
jgi:hypothetical protein